VGSIGPIRGIEKTTSRNAAAFARNPATNGRDR